jgi:hypothetical protein
LEKKTKKNEIRKLLTNNNINFLRRDGTIRNPFTTSAQLLHTVITGDKNSRASSAYVKQNVKFNK